MKLLGIRDDVTVCDCCGKSRLKCTVALETAEGATVYYGRDCAARALGRRCSADKMEYAARGAEWARLTSGVPSTAWHFGAKAPAPWGTEPYAICDRRTPDGRRLIAVNAGSLKRRLAVVSAALGAEFLPVAPTFGTSVGCVEVL